MAFCSVCNCSGGKWNFPFLGMQKQKNETEIRISVSRSTQILKQSIIWCDNYTLFPASKRVLLQLINASNARIRGDKTTLRAVDFQTASPTMIATPPFACTCVARGPLCFNVLIKCFPSLLFVARSPAAAALPFDAVLRRLCFFSASLSHSLSLSRSFVLSLCYPFITFTCRLVMLLSLWVFCLPLLVLHTLRLRFHFKVLSRHFLIHPPPTPQRHNILKHTLLRVSLVPSHLLG